MPRRAVAAGGAQAATPKLDRMRSHLRDATPLSKFKPGVKIVARDKMAALVDLPEQYTYVLSEPAGKNFDPEFKPRYTPAQMLKMGVFEGRYLNDCLNEFPREWFADALDKDTLRPDAADPDVNEFRVKSRKSIFYWRDKGWIPHKDTPSGCDRDARGWFQWYCRYWLGRRIPEVDAVQIKRWKSFGARHKGQIEASYRKMAPSAVPKTPGEKRQHRVRQRQGLLQWSHDCYV